MNKNMRISVRLKAGRDDEIIKWLENVGSNDRSYYIREALRGFLNQGTSQGRIFNNSNTNTIASESKSYDIKPEQNNKEKSISDLSEEELTQKMKGFAN